MLWLRAEAVLNNTQINNNKQKEINLELQNIEKSIILKRRKSQTLGMRKRGKEFVDFILELTLKRGSNVLIPTSPTGRLFECLYLLDRAITESDHPLLKRKITKGIINQQPPLTIAFLHPLAYYSVNLLTSLTEWMPEDLRDRSHDNSSPPIQFKNIHILHVAAQIDSLPQPVCLFVSTSSLFRGGGQAHSAFIRWCSITQNVVLFIERMGLRDCIERGERLFNGVNTNDMEVKEKELMSSNKSSTDQQINKDMEYNASLQMDKDVQNEQIQTNNQIEQSIFTTQVQQQTFSNPLQSNSFQSQLIDIHNGRYILQTSRRVLLIGDEADEWRHQQKEQQQRLENEKLIIKSEEDDNQLGSVAQTTSGVNADDEDEDDKDKGASDGEDDEDKEEAKKEEEVQIRKKMKKLYIDTYGKDISQYRIDCSKVHKPLVFPYKPEIHTMYDEFGILEQKIINGEGQQPTKIQYVPVSLPRIRGIGEEEGQEEDVDNMDYNDRIGMKKDKNRQQIDGDIFIDPQLSSGNLVRLPLTGVNVDQRIVRDKNEQGNMEVAVLIVRHREVEQIRDEYKNLKNLRIQVDKQKAVERRRRKAAFQMQQQQRGKSGQQKVSIALRQQRQIIDRNKSAQLFINLLNDNKFQSWHNRSKSPQPVSKNTITNKQDKQRIDLLGRNQSPSTHKRSQSSSQNQKRHSESTPPNHSDVSVSNISPLTLTLIESLFDSGQLPYKTVIEEDTVEIKCQFYTFPFEGISPAILSSSHLESIGPQQLIIVGNANKEDIDYAQQLEQNIQERNSQIQRTSYSPLLDFLIHSNIHPFVLTRNHPRSKNLCYIYKQLREKLQRVGDEQNTQDDDIGDIYEFPENLFPNRIRFSNSDFKTYTSHTSISATKYSSLIENEFTNEDQLEITTYNSTPHYQNIHQLNEKCFSDCTLHPISVRNIPREATIVLSDLLMERLHFHSLNEGRLRIAPIKAWIQPDIDPNQDLRNNEQGRVNIEKQAQFILLPELRNDDPLEDIISAARMEKAKKIHEKEKKLALNKQTQQSGNEKVMRTDSDAELIESDFVYGYGGGINLRHLLTEIENEGFNAELQHGVLRVIENDDGDEQVQVKKDTAGNILVEATLGEEFDCTRKIIQQNYLYI